MRVVFRVDASDRIGSGHVMRCLALAEGLRATGAEVMFVCAEWPGHLCARIEDPGFPVQRLAPTPDWRQDAAATLAAVGQADWLAVDHYALGIDWERLLRPVARRLLVIDDLGDRAHDCDVLLDQNFGDAGRYAGKLPAGCRRLLGPDYALLRHEFAQARRQCRPRDGTVRRLLVFLGAGDPGDVTLRVVEALASLGAQAPAAEVILGPDHPRRAAIRALAAGLPQVCCHDYVNDMAGLMARADLYVGAPGITTWERCCLGLPSLVVVTAAAQQGPVAALQAAGVLDVLGDAASVSAATIARALTAAMLDPARLAGYSRNSLSLVDGRGVERCVAALRDGESKDQG